MIGASNQYSIDFWPNHQTPTYLKLRIRRQGTRRHHEALPRIEERRPELVRGQRLADRPGGRAQADQFQEPGGSGRAADAQTCVSQFSGSLNWTSVYAFWYSWLGSHSAIMRNACRPFRYCSPRKMIPCDSTHEGSTRVGLLGGQCVRVPTCGAWVQRRKLELEATFESVSSGHVVASTKTIGVFSKGLDAVNLHRPTREAGGANLLEPQLEFQTNS